MFWRSVVGKLAITILLLVSFVLFILTISLLQFFKGFHIQEAEKDMLLTAEKVSELVEQHGNEHSVLELTEAIKDPSSKIVYYFKDGTTWLSKTTNEDLKDVSEVLPINDSDLMSVLRTHDTLKKQAVMETNNTEIMIVGIPILNADGAVFVYQSLDVVNQTKAETTKIIFVAAGIAIVLTTVFAFFLSTRITSPLIKMREAAVDLAQGKFNTKVPILTRDEIGELASAFNRMGRQLKYNINALNQEKEQLFSIVNSMADGVITVNRLGEMIIINPPAEKFIQDLYFESNLDPEAHENQLPRELYSVLQKVIESEAEFLQELNLQGRDWVMIMTPLYDRSYVRGAVAVIRDMTEERQLDKLRKDFIANVSHELRTPIALLQGYSEAIVDDIAESKEEKNELAQIIHEESLRMSRLVNELLDIGRMEAGHIELNEEEVDVDQFVDRIFRKFTGVSEEREIDFQLHKTIVKNHVTLDLDRIEQVFTNLIDNAFNHTESKGAISVTVYSKDDYFYAEIADSGSGISEEDLSFIFERFYKADKSRTRSKKKGTGLGLAIAKHIIEAHGGVVSVKSKLKEGTTFSFKIPQ